MEVGWQETEERQFFLTFPLDSQALRLGIVAKMKNKGCNVML